jgi:hypothetical protein
MSVICDVCDARDVLDDSDYRADCYACDVSVVYDVHDVRDFYDVFDVRDTCDFCDAHVVCEVRIRLKKMLKIPWRWHFKLHYRLPSPYFLEMLNSTLLANAKQCNPISPTSSPA